MARQDLQSNKDATPTRDDFSYFEMRIKEMDLRNQQRFEATEKAINAALAAAKEAVNKAEMATEKRFESVNEFRKTLSDQTATFINRTEFAQMQTTLNEKIDSLKGRADRLEGRDGGFKTSWGILIGVATLAGVAASILTHFLK